MTQNKSKPLLNKQFIVFFNIDLGHKCLKALGSNNFVVLTFINITLKLSKS